MTRRRPRSPPASTPPRAAPAPPGPLGFGPRPPPRHRRAAPAQPTCTGAAGGAPRTLPRAPPPPFANRRSQIAHRLPRNRTPVSSPPPLPFLSHSTRRLPAGRGCRHLPELPGHPAWRSAAASHHGPGRPVDPGRAGRPVDPGRAGRPGP